MAETEGINRLSELLAASISTIVDMDGDDPEALLATNSALSELFNSLDGRTFIGPERELRHVRKLFAEFQRLCEKKAAGNDISFTPHKLKFNTSSADGIIKVKVLEAKACRFLPRSSYSKHKQ